MERWFGITIFTISSDATTRSPDIFLYQATPENGFKLISELIHCITLELGIGHKTLVSKLDLRLKTGSS